jgi:hypothetical protein
VSERQDASGSAGSGKLAGLFHEYGRSWEIEHLDPGSAWVAVTRNGSFVQVIAAHDLDELRAGLKKAETGEPVTRAPNASGVAGRDASAVPPAAVTRA